MAYTPVPSTQTIRFPTLSRVGPRGSVRVVLPWQMRKESARLATFKDWTPGQHGSPSPQALTSAGFICRGVADQAQCFTCSVVVWKWQSEHNPLIEHYRYSPTCQYISNMVPLNESELRQPLHDTSILSSSPNNTLLNDTIPTTEKSRSDWMTASKGTNKECEASLCKICYNQDMCILFRPCGHLLTCISCADQVSSCPVCRCLIIERIRAFVSFE